MAHQDVALKLLHLIRRDDAIFERAKAGGDAIDNLAPCDEFLHRTLRPNFSPCLFRKDNLNGLPFGRGIGHGHDILEGQVLAAQENSSCGCSFMHPG